MRTLPAAALIKGDVIKLPDAYGDEDATVTKVENATPEAGRVTVHLYDGGTIELSAALRVEVVKL